MNPKNNDPSLDYGCYPTLAPLKQTAVRSGIADRERILSFSVASYFLLRYKPFNLFMLKKYPLRYTAHGARLYI